MRVGEKVKAGEDERERERKSQRVETDKLQREASSPR